MSKDKVLKFSSKLEKQVWDLVQEIFSKTQFRIFLHYYIPDIKMQVDIAIPDLHLAIEVQGEQHREKFHYFNQQKIGRGSQEERDKFLEETLQDNGWRVINVFKENINKEYLEQKIFGGVE